MILIRRLDAAGVRAQVDALAAILVDCVDGGASVNFMAPFPAARAAAFWGEMAACVERGARALFVAEEGVRRSAR